MAYYIYSTLSNDQMYTVYDDLVEGQQVRVAQKENRVLINGGANLADKHLVTPRGTVTKVTDAQHDVLKNCASFKAHEKAGYISVEKKKTDVEKAVKKLEGADNSAPITPEFYEGKDSNMDAPTSLVG